MDVIEFCVPFEYMDLSKSILTFSEFHGTSQCLRASWELFCILIAAEKGS